MNASMLTATRPISTPLTIRLLPRHQNSTVIAEMANSAPRDWVPSAAIAQSNMVTVRASLPHRLFNWS